MINPLLGKDHHGHIAITNNTELLYCHGLIRIKSRICEQHTCFNILESTITKQISENWLSPWRKDSVSVKKRDIRHGLGSGNPIILLISVDTKLEC